MKSENEKDFLKHFEKYLDSINKQAKVFGEHSALVGVNSKLHINIAKNIKRLFPRKTVFLKLGKSMLDNVKNMRLTFSKQYSCLDSQSKIITDMKNTAKKIIDEDKKEMIMKIASLLERRVNLIRELIDTWGEYIGISEILGESEIECGKGLMSIDLFTMRYVTFDKKSDFYGEKFILNTGEFLELGDEISELLAKYDEIQNLFGKDERFKKLLLFKR